ncbi:MAG: YCF48-related protein [Actinomycetota bacterium]
MKETSRWVRGPLFLALVALVLTSMLGIASPPARSEVTGGWYQQDTGGSSFLFSVAAADAQNIWAVGSTGYIRHSADGGATWATQSSGTLEDLQEVCAADKNVAWAVGGYGTIVKTVNAGSTWSKQTSGTTNLLMSVSAANASVAWAVGNNGMILKTTNGGSTWKKQTSGIAYILNCVCAVDANTAWAVGGDYNATDGYTHRVILKTTNGGSTWAIQDSINAPASSICAIDASTAWLVGGSGTVFKTSDGGASWISQSAGTYDAFSDVAAADAGNAWVVGDLGVIYRTADGGATWTRQKSGFPFGLFSVDAADKNLVWAVGHNGTILHTVNGGDPVLNASVVSPTSGQPWQVIRVGGTKFGATQGSSYVSFGTVAVTQYVSWSDTEIKCKVPVLPAGDVQVTVHTPEGTSNALPFSVQRPQQGWIYQDSGTNIHLLGADAVDANTCWAVGADGSVLRTTDGGSSWTSRSSGASTLMACISAVNQNTAWIGGNGVLMKTSDGGQSWVTQAADSNYVVTAISAVDANICWAAGGSVNSSGGGFIIRTVDGGVNWSVVYFDPANKLLSICAIGVNTAWAAGGNMPVTPTGGIILRTSDGGANWSAKMGTAHWFSVSALNADTAWAFGIASSGNYFPPLTFPALEKTNDGGVNWISVPAGTSPNGDTTQLLDANTAWTTNLFGIAKTYDGGVSWGVQSWSSQASLRDLSALDANIAWAVGENGTILHTVDGGDGHPVPVVKAIAPASGVQNSSMSISGLSGSGFVAGASVRLEGGGTVVNATNVNVVSGLLITCDLDLQGAPVAAYDVVVRNPDGTEGRFSGGFSVTSPALPCGMGAGMGVLLFGLLMGLMSLAGGGGLARRMAKKR